MAGQGSDRGEDAKQAARSAAKVVLAKHPAVVAGTVAPAPARVDRASSPTIDVGARNIGLGLQRSNPSGAK